MSGGEGSRERERETKQTPAIMKLGVELQPTTPRS